MNTETMSAKEVCFEEIPKGTSCPEAAEKYNIHRNILYAAAYNYGMTWPSAVARRNQLRDIERNGPHKVKWDLKEKAYVVMYEGRKKVASFRTVGRANNFAWAMNRGDFKLLVR